MAPSIPNRLSGDPVKLRQILLHLIDNAIKFTPQGKVVVEALGQLDVRFCVRDSGPGMDRELAARAVEPFFTTREGAAGLGLSQAYAFARQSGGVLSIDSNPGEGAEVSITLPQGG